MRPLSSLFVVFECTTNDDEATTLDFFYEAEDDILPTFGADYLDAISWGLGIRVHHSDGDIEHPATCFGPRI